MTFAVGDVSRASTTDASTITKSPFAVFGDMHPEDGSLLTVTHDGTLVSYTDGAWSYSGTQYWFPKHEHSFVAVHPASVITGPGTYQYNNSQLSFTYNYPSDFRQAADILLATHRRWYDLNSSYKAFPVFFRFHHLLSRIRFQVTVKDSGVEQCYLVITGITFKDITTSATYTVSPAPIPANSTQTDDGGSDEGWTFTGTSDLNISFPEEGSDLLNKVPGDSQPHMILADNDPLLVLPTTTPTSLEITYKMYVPSTQNPGDYDLKEERTVIQTVPIGFAPGKNYLLSLSMVRGIILFNVSVTEWEEGTTTDTSVPRK